MQGTSEVATRRTYSQNEAADVLGVHRNTLMQWRKRNKIRPDAVISEPAADLGIPQNSIVLFDADVIDAVARGEQRLDRAPEPAK